MIDLMKLKANLIIDRTFLRNSELEGLTQDQKIEMKKAYTIEDGLEKIADSIEYAGRKISQRRFLGIF